MEEKTKRDPSKACRESECRNKANSNRGFCHTHYQRYTREQRRRAVERGEKEPLLVPVKLTVRTDGYVLGYAPDVSVA
jgi:hypothetical protein